MKSVVTGKILQLTNDGCGPGSSVGIATDYGLDGPGSNSGGDEIFRPSRPALGPTHPPVQWVPVLSRGRGGRSVGLTTPSHHLVTKVTLRVCVAYEKGENLPTNDG